MAIAGCTLSSAILFKPGNRIFRLARRDRKDGSLHLGKMSPCSLRSCLCSIEHITASRRPQHCGRHADGFGWHCYDQWHRNDLQCSLHCACRCRHWTQCASEHQRPSWCIMPLAVRSTLTSYLARPPNKPRPSVRATKLAMSNTRRMASPQPSTSKAKAATFTAPTSRLYHSRSMSRPLNVFASPFSQHTLTVAT